MPSRPHHVRERLRVEVADAVVLRQTGLRAHAHAGADGRAVQMPVMLELPPRWQEMTRKAGSRTAHPAAVHIKLARPFGHVLPTEQFRRAFGDEFVARAVKSPAADAG